MVQLHLPQLRVRKLRPHIPRGIRGFVDADVHRRIRLRTRHVLRGGSLELLHPAEGSRSADRVRGHGPEGKKRLPSLVSRTLGILGAAAPAACSPPRLTAEALREKPFLEAASMAPRTRWWWEGGESRALEPQTSCGTHILFPPRTSWLRKVTRSQRAAGPFPATHRAPAQSLDQPGPPSYCSPFLKPPGSCRCRQES